MLKKGKEYKNLSAKWDIPRIVPGILWD